jgi:hypothetical protein
VNRCWHILVVLTCGATACGVPSATVRSAGDAVSSELPVAQLPQVAFATDDHAMGAVQLWDDASPTALNVRSGAQGSQMFEITLVFKSAWPLPVAANVKLLDETGQRLWSNHVRAELAPIGALWRLPDVWLLVNGCSVNGRTFTVTADVDFGSELQSTLQAAVRLHFAGPCP